MNWDRRNRRPWSWNSCGFWGEGGTARRARSTRGWRLTRARTTRRQLARAGDRTSAHCHQLGDSVSKQCASRPEVAAEGGSRSAESACDFTGPIRLRLHAACQRRAMFKTSDERPKKPVASPPRCLPASSGVQNWRTLGSLSRSAPARSYSCVFDHVPRPLHRLFLGSP